jgi:hypothetical protein
MVAQVEYSVAGRLRGRVALCAVHRACGDEKHGFLG